MAATGGIMAIVTVAGLVLWWKRAKRAKIDKPRSQITPSPRDHSSDIKTGTAEDAPGASENVTVRDKKAESVRDKKAEPRFLPYLDVAAVDEGVAAGRLHTGVLQIDRRRGRDGRTWLKITGGDDISFEPGTDGDKKEKRGRHKGKKHASGMPGEMLNRALEGDVVAVRPSHSGHFQI